MKLLGTILTISMIGLAYIFGLGIYSSIIQDRRFNQWASDCNNQQGVISQTEWGLTHSRYECFVNGKKTVLPGWEKY